MYSYFMIVDRCIEVEETLFGRNMTLVYTNVDKTDHKIKVKFDKLVFKEEKIFDVPDINKLLINQMVGIKGRILQDGLYAEKLVSFGGNLC